MATRAAVNRQVRGFAVIWTVITFIIGAATFFGIYLSYNGGFTPEGDAAVSIAATLPPTQSAALATSVPTAAVPTRAAPDPTRTPPEEPTSVPTEADAPADAPDSEAQAVAQAPTLAPTLLPVADTDYQVGIQVQKAFDRGVQEAWMNDVSNLGLGWIKQQVRWEIVETTQGQYEEGEFGRIAMSLDVAAERGVKVMLSIVTTPDWAREPGVSLEEEGPPANIQLYVDFVVDLVERFPGKIHGIEVWNEMNIAREWTSTGGLSAANYVTLLRATYEAVKNVDPGIIIISGALAPTGVSDGINAIDDFVYMEQLVDAGMLNYTDCVGAHHNGYNISPSLTWDNVPNDPTAQFRGPFDNPHHSWSFRSTLQTYANIVQQVDPGMRLCVTEFGWPSMDGLGDGFPQGFEFALDNTAEEQSQWTIEALNNMDEWGIVWLAFIWNLNYGPQIGWDTANDNTPYSIIGPNFSRRPVYDAVVAWSQQRAAGQ